MPEGTPETTVQASEATFSGALIYTPGMVGTRRSECGATPSSLTRSKPTAPALPPTSQEPAKIGSAAGFDYVCLDM